MYTTTRNILLGGSVILVAGGCASYEDAGDAADTDSPGVAAQQDDPIQQVPPPPGVMFTTVEAFGSGCPANTPGENDSYYPEINPERDAFTVEFYKFRTNVTPSDVRPDNSLSCTLRVGLTVPRNYSYAVTEIVYEGQTNLPQGVTGNFVTSYGYQGSGIAPVNITHPLKAPSSLEQFKFRDVLESTPVGIRWSNCGETQLLNANMVIQVRNPEKKEGWAELSFADGEVRPTREDPTPSQIPGVKVKLAWRRCPLN
jgi:hypothetical protein